jgi:hypothetical protein
MNKVLLISFLFFSKYSFSQVERVFKTKDRQAVTDFVNEILVNTTKKYNQVRIDTSKQNNSINFWYSDGENFLNIYFYKFTEGGNKDLEIVGETYYGLQSIKGIYKDLFPFWKKYFEGDAEFNQVALSKHGKTMQIPYGGRKYVATFNGPDVWQLDIKDYTTPN